MLVGKRNGENKNLKECVWTTIFQKKHTKYLVVRRTTIISQFVKIRKGLSYFNLIKEAPTALG